MSLKSYLIVYNWPMQRQHSVWHSLSNKIAQVQFPTTNQRFTWQLVDNAYLLLDNFPCFFCRWPIFFKIIFFEKIPSGIDTIIRVSNSLDTDQTQHCVGTDLGPNCLQRLSADNTGRQKVKEGMVLGKVNCRGCDMVKIKDTAMSKI